MEKDRGCVTFIVLAAC